MPSLVSGPFNVQHSVAALPAKEETTSSRNEPLVNAAIVVCICRFSAEYPNELSATPGDVFKVVSPDVVNGWLLVQSLSTGVKGWVPHHNLTSIDMFNTKKNTTSSGTILPNLSCSTTRDSSSSSTTSFIDCYTNDTSASSTSSLTASSYTSLYVHSMFSVNSSFCYRIDLSTSNSSTFHVARYYSDINTLNSYLNSIIHNTPSSSHIKLPSLPNPISLDDYDSVEKLSQNISLMNKYLQQVFKLFNNTPCHPLYSALALFLTPSGNDFQHYVELSDEQIWKILKPSENHLSMASSNNKSIELELKSDSPLPSPTTYVSDNSFTFTKPGIQKSSSMMSINSKVSNTSTVNSLSTFNNTPSSSVRIKIVYKDEFSLLKLDSVNLDFLTLSEAISSKITHSGPLTFAYKNENNIFVLLRDNVGLKKALTYNNRKLVIKVI